MNILFLNGKDKGGPVVWKNGLVESLKKNKIKCYEYKLPLYPSLLDIYKCLKQFKNIDIIHAYSEGPNQIILLILARLLKKKTIYTLHGDYFLQSKSKIWWKRLFWIPANDLCIKLVNKVTFPSKYLFEVIAKKRNFIFDKGIVIHNGINTNNIKKIKSLKKSNLGFKKNSFLLCSVTNFDYYEKAKGIELIINAFNILEKKYKNLFLIILGSGKYKNLFEKKLNSKKIKFLGYKENAISYIKMANIFIYGTFLDSFGYTILEAMCCKKPIISVRVGGIPEIINNSLIVEPRSDKMYEKLEEIYLNKKKRKKFANYALNKSKSFDWKIISKKFLELYY